MRKEHMIFVLEDDNEIMTSALDSDLSESNKMMNKSLINKHNIIIERIKKDIPLSKTDLQLIRDANEIHLNDEANLNGHHKEAVELENYLKTKLR